MDSTAAIDFLEHWGYPAFTALLLLTGIGSPVPEDLLLVVAGYLIASGVFSWPVTLLLGLIGVMGSDIFLYVLGMRVARHASNFKWVQRLVSVGKPGVAAAWVDKYGALAVFFARLVPGTRYLVFISAGMHGVPARRFVLFDALGAVVWVPFLLLVGSKLGEELGGIDALLRGIGTFALWGALALIVGVTAWRRFFRRGNW